MARSDRTLAAPKNPFSAYRILPGTIPYLFSHEHDSTDLNQLDRLINAWQAGGYQGQITGAHGCGKTTLAYAIAKQAVENGLHPFDSMNPLIIRSRSLIRTESGPSWLARLFKLHSTSVTFGTPSCFNLKPMREQENRLHSLTRQTTKSRPEALHKTILVIDGIERLTLTQQALMLHSLKRQRIPTLLTTHRVSKRLPFVGVRCPVLFRAASDIKAFTKIVNLMTCGSDFIDSSAIEASFEASEGNVRNALMRLYDVFDSQSRSQQQRST